MASFDCIVVGAGFSGLAAAKSLDATGKKILLIEAQDRVGGRSKTVRASDGTYTDYGASFVGYYHEQMISLADELGLKLYEMPQDGKLVLVHRGQAKSYTGFIPPFRPWEVIDAGIAIHKFETLCDQVDLEQPWKTPNAEELDSITVEEWFRKTCWTKAARDTSTMGIEATFGTGPASVSILHAMFFFKSNINFTNACSVQGGAQHYLVDGGTQAIADKMRERLTDSIVHLGEPVQSIHYNGEIVEMTTSKRNYTCKRVIFTVPPPLLQKIIFSPALPPQKISLLQHMPMGAYIKVVATYKKRFWAEKGLRGETTSTNGFAAVIFDATSMSGSPPKLQAFVGGAKARKFLGFGEEERRQIMLSELALALGEEALEPEEFHIHTLMEDEWSLGCPYANPVPGTWTSLGEWLRKPIGPFYWAGTETATKFCGYMEGAVLAGQRAAKEVIGSLA